MLAIAVIAVSAVIVGLDYYKLSKQQIIVPEVNSVYQIRYFYGGTRQSMYLTDTDCIAQIVEKLPNSKATHKRAYEVGTQEFSLWLYYINENNEEEIADYTVHRINGKAYISPFYEDSVWSISDDFYQFLFETEIKLKKGELK